MNIKNTQSPIHTLAEAIGKLPILKLGIVELESSLPSHATCLHHSKYSYVGYSKYSVTYKL